VPAIGTLSVDVTLAPIDGHSRWRYAAAIRWCCTHRPPRSVTDAEEPLIVAPRASINSYLERAGKRSAMRTSIISLDPDALLRTLIEIEQSS